MPTLPIRCPSCGEKLKVARLTCGSCELQLEGSFDIPELLSLPAEDLEFIVAFVQASGSLKEMAQLRGQSYPTIRNRLNEIIAKLKATRSSAEKKRHQILDAISKGEISVKEGARRLKEVDK
jgi:hypothetical protein